MIVLRVTPSMTTPDLAADPARARAAEDRRPSGSAGGSCHGPDRLLRLGASGAAADCRTRMSSSAWRKRCRRRSCRARATALPMRWSWRQGAFRWPAGRLHRDPGRHGGARPDRCVARHEREQSAGQHPSPWRRRIASMPIRPCRRSRPSRCLAGQGDGRSGDNDVARRSARQGQPADVVGEGTRWQEAGYWLAPLIALIVLGWFRRGWVVADMRRQRRQGLHGITGHDLRHCRRCRWRPPACGPAGRTCSARPTSGGAGTWSGAGYAEAAASFPIRCGGSALFRAGQFKEAAQTFGGIDTAEAAYDQGNALVMLGKYEEAIARYDRALVLRPGWSGCRGQPDAGRVARRAHEAEGGERGDQRESPTRSSSTRTRSAGEGRMTR